MRPVRAAVVMVLALAACGGEEAAGSTSQPRTSSSIADAASESGCADVVDVEVEAVGGAYTFDVTVSSADTGWDKYADLWEVRGPGGEVLGTRELAHPHVNEQPFTRSLSGVEIPPGITEIVVAARDSVGGFCGETLTVSMPD